MLAAVYHGPNDLRVDERPIPQITADEILLKVESASICGTDLRILHGNHRMYPAGTLRIPGHDTVYQQCLDAAYNRKPAAGSVAIRLDNACLLLPISAAVTAANAYLATTTAVLIIRPSG